MDDAIARDRAAAVDRLFTLEGGESPARLANQDRRRTDIIGLHPWVDHRVRTPQKNLPVPVEIRAAASDIARIGQANERLSDPGHRELLQPAMGDRSVGQGSQLRYTHLRAIVRRAVALNGRKEIVVRRHVRQTNDRNPFGLDAQEHRPGCPTPDEGACSVDRINDESNSLAVAMTPGFLPEEACVWVGREHVVANDLFGLAIGDGDRAPVGLFFRHDSSLKMLQRRVPCATHEIFQRAQPLHSANTIGVELDAHGRSMTCLTGSVKR